MVFQGLAGLLRGISRGQSQREIRYSSVLAFLKSTDGSVLALLKSTDGTVLALLRLPSIISCQNSTVGEFWCTMAFMQEKQQNFEIECFYLVIQVRSSGMYDIFGLAGTFVTRHSKQNSVKKNYSGYMKVPWFEISPTLTDWCHMELSMQFRWVHT